MAVFKRGGVWWYKFCELSAGVRTSEAVALGDPVMPVFDGLGG